MNIRENLPPRGGQSVSPSPDPTQSRYTSQNQLGRESGLTGSGAESNMNLPLQYDARRPEPYRIPREQKQYYSSAGNLSILESRYQRQFGSKQSGTGNNTMQSHYLRESTPELDQTVKEKSPDRTRDNMELMSHEKDLDTKIEEFR